MIVLSNYKSPNGNILLAADEEGICGLWFENQKYYASNLKNKKAEIEKDVDIVKDKRRETIKILKEAKKWLDLYFEGKKPDFKIKMHIIGTDFQKDVWETLLSIPYGQVVTYGDIAKKLAKKNNKDKMSSRAVGGAVRT